MDGQSSPVSPRESAPANARTFKPSAKDRWGMTAIGVLCLVGAGAVPFFLEAHQSPLLMAGMCVAMGVVFLFIGEFVLARRRLVLTDDGAELRTLMGTRTLASSAIKGFRRGGDTKHPTLELIPAETGAKKLSLPLTLEGSDAIVGWAASRFPDLDAIEMQTDLEAILADEEFGFTVEERQAFLDRQQLVFKVLTVAAAAVALWALFFPRPYEVAMIAQVVVLVAALAAGALGRGLLVLWGKGKAHPTAIVAVVLPGIVLLARAFMDFTIDAWTPALVPVAVATLGVAFLILLCFRETRESPTSMGGALLLAAFIGAGGVLQIDVLTDDAEALVQETTVLDMRVSNGKSKTYTLVLAPWKEGQTQVDYTTDEETYASFEPGMTAWLWTKPGALKIPWTFVTVPME